MTTRKPVVLIFSSKADFHAAAVIWALNRLGAAVVVQDNLRVGDKTTHSLEFSSNRMLEDCRFTSVWWHRPTDLKRNLACNVADEKFLINEWNIFQKGVLCCLDQSSLWVNRWVPAHLAEFKPTQFRAAQQVGIMIPKTLYSNDPAHIKRFVTDNVRDGSGLTIIKPHTQFLWTYDSGLARPASPHAIDLDYVCGHPDSLRICPAIYQEYVPTQADIRVTVIGSHIFALKVSGEREYVKANPGSWRQFGETDRYKTEVIEIGAKLRAKIYAFMRTLDLTFGALDFIETPGGDWLFLEVNQSGQFLFCEDWCPEVPLLFSFAKMLSAGSHQYDIDDDHKDVSVNAFVESKEYVELMNREPRTYENLQARDV